MHLIQSIDDLAIYSSVEGGSVSSGKVHPEYLSSEADLSFEDDHKDLLYHLSSSDQEDFKFDYLMRKATRNKLYKC